MQPHGLKGEKKEWLESVGGLLVIVGKRARLVGRIEPAGWNLEPAALTPTEISWIETLSGLRKRELPEVFLMVQAQAGAALCCPDLCLTVGLGGPERSVRPGDGVGAGHGPGSGRSILVLP
ncbi:unnamed protein product [Scytosiphon promiscuus]